MKHLFFIAIVLLIAVSFNCKKDSGNTSTQTDCEKNHYGIYKVTFSNDTLGHYIAISGIVSYGAIERELAPGKLSDTFHLSPDVYKLTIASHISPNMPAINFRDTAVNITTCQETDEFFSF